MKETEEKLTNMHVGRLIHMMSHQMKRDSNSVASAIENDELTIMQKHVLNLFFWSLSTETFIRRILKKNFRSGNPQSQGSSNSWRNMGIFTEKV